MKEYPKELRRSLRNIENLRTRRYQNKIEQSNRTKFLKLLEKRFQNETVEDQQDIRIILKRKIVPEKSQHQCKRKKLKPLILRRQLLQEWKEKKKKKLSLERKKAKPAFKYCNVNTTSVPVFKFEIEKADIQKANLQFCPKHSTEKNLFLRRSERIKKKNEQKPKDEIIYKSKNVTINVEKCQSASDFYLLLELNQNQLENLCSLWKRIKRSKKLEKSKRDNIDSIIEQTNLLISKKFKKFRTTIQKFDRQLKTNNSRKLSVTLEDLKSFWMELSIPIKELKKSFENLRTSHDEAIVYFEDAGKF